MASPLASELSIESVEACGLCGSMSTSPLFEIHQFRFARCGSCGLVRLDRRVAPDSLAQLYGTGYLAEVGSSQQIEEELRNPTFAYRRAVLERHTRARFLMEIGCGDGNFLAYLQRHGWQGSGTEISQQAVDVVRLKHGLTIHQGTYTELDFADESFPVIGMYHVLEHLYDPIPAMEAVRRTLRADGIVHIQVPSADAIEAILATRYYWGLQTPQHPYLYGRATIRRLLTSVGLRVVSVRTYDPWHSPAITANTMRGLIAAIVGRRTSPDLAIGHLGESATSDRAVQVASSEIRTAAEAILGWTAWALSRGEALLGRGNILDVVARKS